MHRNVKFFNNISCIYIHRFLMPSHTSSMLQLYIIIIGVVIIIIMVQL